MIDEEKKTFIDSDVIDCDDSYSEDSDPISLLESLEELSIKNNSVEENSTEEISPEKAEYREIVYSYSGDHRKAIFKYCFLHNIFYNSDTVNFIMKHGNDEEFEKLPELYVDTIEANYNFKGLTFFDQIHEDNFEQIYSEELTLLTLTEDDKKNRQQVIDILGYDPFKDDDPEDRPQLYRDMTGMLTESMRKDVAKAKAALSVVRGYANVDKYQQKITEIMASGQVDEDTQKRLDTYIKMQKTVQDSINQTAEKNNFTVKGIGSNGRGMLSDVMNQVEERGYDKGITNFYDIATSKSIMEINAISWKAQLAQIALSKTDYCDILANQAELVKKALATSRDAMEALRLAKEKITKQELLEELEKDYRRKGISEEEIKEFISREYDIRDGKDD